MVQKFVLTIHPSPPRKARRSHRGRSYFGMAAPCGAADVQCPGPLGSESNPRSGRFTLFLASYHSLHAPCSPSYVLPAPRASRDSLGTSEHRQHTLVRLLSWWRSYRSFGLSACSPTHVSTGSLQVASVYFRKTPTLAPFGVGYAYSAFAHTGIRSLSITDCSSRPRQSCCLLP